MLDDVTYILNLETPNNLEKGFVSLLLHGKRDF